MFLNQHDDFLKIYSWDFPILLHYVMDFSRVSIFLSGECILAIAMPCDLYGLTKSFVYSTVYVFSVKSI